jgi:hypothetical protein
VIAAAGELASEWNILPWGTGRQLPIGAFSAKRRIDEAAKYVPLEQLALSPQCGFASTEEGNVLTEEEQWAKLRLCVEVARGLGRRLTPPLV